MQTKNTGGFNSTDPERNGPPHNNSNGAAVGGTANQTQGVGQGAGGPGDGQGPGLGAGQGQGQGQGQPQSQPTQDNSDQALPSDGTEDADNTQPQGSENPTDNDSPFIHPEPPTDTSETLTDDSTPSADPERNGPPHNNSNGAAVGGTANQTQGVGQGAGGPGDGQGPGLGAGQGQGQGQGQPQSQPTQDNSDQALPSDGTEDADNTQPQGSENPTDNDSPFIHPEPPTDTSETLTDDSTPSAEQLQPADQPQGNNPSSDQTSANNEEPGETSTPQEPLTNQEELTESKPSTEEEDLISEDGILQVKPSDCENTTLKIKLTADCGNINRLAFVKVDHDPLTGTSINGEEANDSDAFRKLIQCNLVDPNDSAIYIGGKTEKTILWDLKCVDAGHYAPVMITQSGDILTMGSAADGREHIMITGGDTFNFEDLLSHQNSDWDYNDLTVKLMEI